jgi:hypothetical protein
VTNKKGWRIKQAGLVVAAVTMLRLVFLASTLPYAVVATTAIAVATATRASPAIGDAGGVPHSQRATL